MLRMSLKKHETIRNLHHNRRKRDNVGKEYNYWSSLLYDMTDCSDDFLTKALHENGHKIITRYKINKKNIKIKNCDNSLMGMCSERGVNLKKKLKEFKKY